MRSTRFRLLALLALVLMVFSAACGGDDDPAVDAGDDDTGATDPTEGDDEASGSITVGSFGFGESEILAYIYGKALEEAGVDVSYEVRLGAREIVAPALEKGEIDLVPEYVGNLLAFYDADASEPGDDVDASTTKLRELAEAKGLVVLEPSQAADGDVLVMTKKRAKELSVEQLSDLEGKSDQLVLGGPPECTDRITCLKGLQDIYNLQFKEFKALDTGGPITVKALADGDIDLARLFSSDPAIAANDFVVIDDDKFIQPAGNVVPVIREEALTDEIEKILDEVSSTLTTEDLIELNTKVDVEKEDAEDVAAEWLEENL